MAFALWAGLANATTFTTTVPGTNITLPDDYPEAGGVAIVMVGVNGNVYYQFSDPANAFRGRNNRANRDELEGNPFTVNDPIPLNCGFSSCRAYFGGDLARVYIRFSAYDGDTQVGGFDQNDIDLVINGFDVGNWSGRITEITDFTGTRSQGFVNGFGNNTFNTGWFDSTNPALLDSLLDTGRTTTQVRDRDPNDNFWNFQFGDSLARPEIATVAPGYTIEKAASAPTFTNLPDSVTYTYTVSNIGSVAIRDLQIDDDQIDESATPITCNKTTIQPRPFNDPRGPDQAVCTVVYNFDQDDIDAGQHTNTVVATGDPDEGVLGQVSDTVTVTGPAANPSLDVVKTSVLNQPGQNFGNAGSTVPYVITATNDGNVTLTDVRLTDDLIPSFSCTIARLEPGESDSCSVSYTVKQSDVDDFAANPANELTNVGRGTATAARGPNPSDFDQDQIPGPAAAPDFTIAKTALNGTYSAEGETLQYNVEIRNTGNVTFPNAPTVTEALAGATVNCPAGPVAPNATVVCQVSYDVQQVDINDGQIDNTVTADITVGGVNVNKSASATVPATRSTGLSLVKRLAASSRSSFDDAGQVIDYEYVLTNTGNVTLTSPNVADDVIDGAGGSVTCPPGDIAPNGTLTCSASYTTTQPDLNAGEIVNIATATATTAGAGGAETVTSTDQTVTVPAVQTPGLTLVKTGADPASFTIGATVTYTFAVTNSGNTDIPGPITINDNKLGNDLPCLAGPLARGVSDSCTIDYQLTTEDVAAGAVTNVASATDGTTTSPEASATVSNAGTPAIRVTKEALTNPIGATDTSVRYRFIIENIGDTQIIESVSPITITDDKINVSPFVCAGRQPSVLNVGASYDCQRNYNSISQAERDAGEVVNTVSGSFPFNTGTGTIQVTSQEFVETTPITQDLSFTFAKEQDGPDTFLAVGDVLDYTFTIVNDGNVTLTSVSISDTLIPNVSCPVTDLAPGATGTCTAQYTVTQPDVDRGTITNTATATGTSAQGGQFTPPASTEVSTLDPAGARFGLAVSKTANKPSFATLGEEITYTIEVINDGTKTLTNTTVTDILDPAYSCTIPTLAPNAVSNLCQFTHIVTQDDIDTGSITNTATATNPLVTDGPDSSTQTLQGPPREAEIEIEKTALGSYANVGDTVDFAIRVRNTGNITARGVSVEDASIFTPAETCTVGDIAPGFDAVVCTVSYTVDQDDIDLGSVTNTATVTGTGADGTPLSETGTDTADGPAANPQVQVVKTPSATSYTGPGDSIDFSFTVTNTGNVTLTNLELVDVDGDGETFRCDVANLPPAPAANSTTTCVGGAPMLVSKSFDQGDVDAASYTNTATVTGESLVGGTPVSDTDPVTVTGPAQTLSLTIDKRETLGTTFDAVGQVITYEYDVTNTSNVTVNGAITVADSVISRSPAVDVPVACPSVPATGLAPGAVLTCSASYTVTQDDIDNGAVTNSATASTAQRINGEPDPTTTTSAPDTATVNADQQPAFTIAKAIKAGSATTFTNVGDQITYEYTVTNTGNETLTSPITVSDDQISGTTTCGPVPVAPGDSVTCELVWSATQTAINDGFITNIGTASSPDVPTDATDTFTANAVQEPELAVEKNSTGGTFQFPGTVTYEYIITNPGNTEIDTANLTVTDSRINSVSCPAGGGILEPLRINPAASYTCTASYPLTLQDIQLGEVTNLATVSDGITTSPQTSETVPAGADPSLSVVKTATSGADFDEVGDIIEYEFVVTNTSVNPPGASFTEPVEIVDDKIGAAFVCFTPTPTDLFNAGETETCTAQYAVTQADLDAGEVVNEAIATTIFAPASPNPITVVSAPATATTGGAPAPGLTVAKSVSGGPAEPEAGETIQYTIVTTNTGNQTLTQVMTSDSLIPTLACTVADGSGGQIAAPASVTLLPGEALTCTGDYTLTQANIDDQQVVNTARSMGNDPRGNNVPGEVTNTFTAVDPPLPELSVTKTVTPAPGVGDPAFAGVDETVTFAIEVINSGNITVDSISVTDTVSATNAATPATCSVGSLAPGEISTACTFEVVVTQAEIDAGSFDNTATATGTPRAGTLAPGEDTITVQGPDAAPAFAMSKTADVSDFTAAGDVITYSFTVGNAGNVTLSAAPVIDDPKVGAVNCPALPAGGLPPTESITCTAQYAVTQDDMDAGQVINEASVTSTEVTTPATATSTVTGTRTPGVSLVKTPSIPADAAEGDVIEYTYTVTNTGNTRLFDVGVTDTQTSAAGDAALTIGGDILASDTGPLGDSLDAGADGSWDTLAPGDVAEFTASYTVTQADVDSGNPLTNTASISATGPPGTTPPSDTATVTVPVEDTTPALDVVKLVSSSTGSAAGDTVTFAITVRNSGNVTLDAPTLVDTLTRTDGTTLTLTSGPDWDTADTGTAGKLDVGETWTYTATYMLEQADIDAGGVANSVLATSAGPNGDPTQDRSGNGQPGGEDRPTVFSVPSAPAIEGEKTVTSSTVAVDEVVTFAITATNTGNVTLSGVTVASDTLTRADGTALTLASGPTFQSADQGSASGTLIPGETATFVASYRLQQADIDAGGIANTATVSGTPPVGAPVSDVTDNGDDGDGNTADDPTVLDVPADPQLSIVKALAAGEPGNFDTLDQEVAFEFTVTNTGNVTLSGPFTVVDELIEEQGNAVTCPAATLAPGDEVICNGSYFVTQDDLDRGSFTNAATATDGTATSPEDTVTVPGLQNPSMAVVKEAEDVPPADFDEGLEVEYTYTVTNDGNVTLTDPITVSDNLIPNVVCDALPAGGLLPTQSLTCVGTYTVTADDVALFTVTNLASSTSGTTTSPLVSETIPNDAEPSISIVKTAEAGATFAEVGDLVRYTFEVTNDGTQAFSAAVTIFDDKIPGGDVGLDCPLPAGDATLSAGQTISCSFDYPVTQADLDAGEVINEAFAQTTFGADDTPVTSAPTTETVAATSQPALTLDKTSAPNPAGPVGSTITYTLVATNTGNRTLNTVAVTDDRLPGLVCEAATLARGDSLTCSEDYEVTQEDIDAGSIFNEATVTAQTPTGEMVEPVTGTETTGVPAAAPGLSVVKSASPSVLGAVGSDVTFSFNVTNTGTTTLENISVDDALDTGPACTIARLAPGESDAVSCSFMLEVTQQMIDDGEVTNDVTVDGTDLLGNPTEATDSITVPGPARLPALEATKIATTTGQDVDDVVTYFLSVENTGNVTLTAPAITDTMTRNNNTPTVLSTPFVLDRGDTDGDRALDVGETWVYSATHIITQSDVNAGGFRNTATATADGTAGTGTVSDVSDNGNDGDGNTTDDPTPFNITAEPQITTVKAVSGTPGDEAGETVVWTITARNTGNVDITGVSVSDNLTRADGTVLPEPAIQNLSGTTDLPAGGEVVWQVTHTLTQDDIDAGGLSNSATVQGEGPQGQPVRDVSSNDDPFDGNNEDDPTVLGIAAAPALDVVKTLTTPGLRATDVITFDITVANSGNVTLSGVTVADSMTRIGGGALDNVDVRFVSATDGSPEGTLQVDETATYEVRYSLLQEDVDAGGVSNTATGTATTPLGATLSDVSRDDDPNDGNDLDDPTVATIEAQPENTLTKTAGEPRVLFPGVYQVTFTLVTTNTGNITQSGYQVSDDLGDFIAGATLLTDAPFGIEARVSGFAGSATGNPAYDGASVIDTISGDASLAPNQSGTVEIDVTYEVAPGVATGGNVGQVTSDDLPTATPSNPATVPLVDTDGDGVPDALEGCAPLAGNDRDGDGICDAEDFDPTGYFYCEDDGRILPGGSISVSGPAGTQTGVGFSNNIRIVQDGSNGQFVFFVTRPGTYTLSATYPSLGQPSTTRTSLGTLDATTLLPANPASIGGSEVGNANVLSDFTAGGNPFYTTFTFEPGDPFVLNNNLPLENCQAIPDILATKQADRESAVFGETVNFTLAFTNNTSNTVSNMNLVDLLPAGMLYTPNSAAVDGVPTEPTSAGLRLTWGGLSIAPAQTINVTLAARVVANGSYGELTNRAFMTDAAGNQLSNTATATVRIEPEHVFDCSDIIGKVYDDRNQNGYQDQGEPGLPGVRLATVRGHLITTDEYGRYHVPCAELPKSIGSNFTLKLDTRTLPSGYRVTTENPRVIRVTAGKFAKLNFGAALSNVVDIDLTARAFTADGQPSAALVKGVERLVASIRTTPSVLRLSYILRGEDPREARARTKLVEDLIREKWRGGGRYKLNIERTIKRAKQGGADQ